MSDDSPLAVPYPAVSRKKVTAAFDGGRLSSNSGVLPRGIAERRRGLAKTLAALIADRRAPAHITHTVEDILRAPVALSAFASRKSPEINVRFSAVFCRSLFMAPRRAGRSP